MAAAGWKYKTATLPATAAALLQACREADAEGWEIVGGPAVVLVDAGAGIDPRGNVVRQQAPAFVVLARRPAAAEEADGAPATFDGIIRGA